MPLIDAHRLKKERGSNSIKALRKNSAGVFFAIYFATYSTNPPHCPIMMENYHASTPLFGMPMDYPPWMGSQTSIGWHKHCWWKCLVEEDVSGLNMPDTTSLSCCKSTYRAYYNLAVLDGNIHHQFPDKFESYVKSVYEKIILCAGSFSGFLLRFKYKNKTAHWKCYPT